MNNTLKRAVLKIVSREPFLELLRRIKLKNRVVVLMYHEIAEDDAETDAWTVIKKSDFVKQMEYLVQHFDIVSLSDALVRVSEWKDHKRPMAVVTFDDGYAGYVKTLLPIIKKMDLPVTVFIATSAVQNQTVYWYDRLMNEWQGRQNLRVDLKKYLSAEYVINQRSGIENWIEMMKVLEALKTVNPYDREQAVKEILSGLSHLQQNDGFKFTPLSEAGVRSLAECRQITIGAHTHDHNILTQVALVDAKESIMMSKQLLESWTGRPVHYFAYPNGNYNTSLIKIVQDAKYHCSMTTKGHLWESTTSRYEIPRIGIGRYDSLDLFKYKTAGGLS